MPGIHTHLNLAQRLLKEITVESPGAFLLGNAYPDRFGESIQKSIELHYKQALHDPCDLGAFLDAEPRDDFTLGYYFHLWVDNRMMTVDVQDIQKLDCLICDMEVIGPAIQAARDHAATDRERQALRNILELEQKPVPLYSVPEEKKKRYDKILYSMVRDFICEEWRKINVH